VETRWKGYRIAAPTTGSPGRPTRLALVLLLQCLPLLGLGGCAAVWATTPVGPFLREASAPAFWAFTGLIYGLAGLSLCWGLGYLYAGERERLGCALALAGPLLVILCYGYLFEGFRLSRTDADEARRGQAMLWTLLVCAGPALLMAWDAWRRARRPRAGP
jgi:hypothetical protein